MQDKLEEKQDKKRLKLIGTEYKSEESQSTQDQTKADLGHVFKESTEAISSMAKDMQEAAQLASTMKTELEEKRSRIADLLATGSPLSDPFKTQTKLPSVTKHSGSNKLKNAPNDQDSSNHSYEMVSAKLDMIIEQNKEIIALLNSKFVPN